MQTIIQKNQVVQRWDTLPQEIRDAITSDKNADALDRIYINLHIPPDKQKYVALVASYVFMGFVHLEDMAKEIEEAIGINSLHARELADAITQNILVPYRDTLEKIYTGKIVESARPSLDSVRAPEPKPAAPAASGPAPKSLETISAGVAAPTKPEERKAVPTPASMPNIISAPSAGGSASAVIPPKPVSPAGKPAPAPFMIHAESKLAPVSPAPKFKFEPLGAIGSSLFGEKKAPAAPPPPKPAQIEIGKGEKLKPAETFSKFEIPQRVIHYSGLSSPIIQTGGPVNVLPASAPPRRDGPASPSFGEASPMPKSPISPPAAAIPSVTRIPVKNPLAPPASGSIQSSGFGNFLKDSASLKKPEEKKNNGTASAAPNQTPPPRP